MTIPAELKPLAEAIGRVPPCCGHDAANDNLPRIVALAGAAGSGKSTAADYLIAEYGYTRVKFAGPLKAMLRAIGLDDRHIEGDLKEMPLDELCGRTPRYAMQTLGTEWGRKCLGDDFWVNLWREESLRHKRVVVDDCRFPNEAEAVRREGGIVIKLEGRGGISGGHASETGCGKPDCTVINDGSLADLHHRIECALRLAA